MWGKFHDRMKNAVLKSHRLKASEKVVIACVHLLLRQPWEHFLKTPDDKLRCFMR